MKTIIFVILALTLLVLASLYVWRLSDHRADRVEIERLLALQPAHPPIFNRSLVLDLPEPARRYFEFTIQDGAPLYSVAKIWMNGQFGMGDLDVPNYMPMNAQQVLAAPEGFLWRMTGGSGLMSISGSDSASWTRFWAAGIVPVARAGGTPDHALSGFGRYLSEAVFWTPAVVLPGPGVKWEAIDENTARVTMAHDGNAQAVDVTVDADGRPVQVVLLRWSNANTAGEYQFQPFGGYLSKFREFDGFRLPTHIEAGNFFGTDAYFPFFIADITNVQFAKSNTLQ